MRGILRFCQTHQCNNICRYLDLPPINPKQKDSGTVCMRSPLKNPANGVTKHGFQSGHVTATPLQKKSKQNNCKSRPPLSTRNVNTSHPNHKSQSRVVGEQNKAVCTQATPRTRQLVPKPFQENHYFAKDEDLSRHLVLAGSRRTRTRTLGATPRDAPTCSTCVVM